jgi:hypothetical protein
MSTVELGRSCLIIKAAPYVDMNRGRTKKAWLHNLRRKTRKRHNIKNIKIFPELLHYSESDYLSNGSYGSVYVLPGYDGRYVLKHHQILDKDVKTCGDWDQEFKMHRGIYNACSHLLKPLKISIVRPYSFGYGKYITDSLHVVGDVENASHCYIIMDRIFGRRGAPNSPHIEKKLDWLLGSHKKYKPVHYLPPYLFFGTLQKPGVLSLDLLGGANTTDFPNESLNYCTIEGHAYSAVKWMMMGFFIIAGAGYAPRDIEYVLNGNAGGELMTVLDYNEVGTWTERRKAVGPAVPYDIDVDLAHIYIDLCGLRKMAHPNPMAPYDGPTPQWKFLCNPIVCPRGFFKAVIAIYKNLPTEDYPFNFWAVIKHIVAYIQTHWLHPVKCPWEPVRVEFTPLVEFKQFDICFQKHIISNLWMLVRDQSDLEAHVGTSYSEMLDILQKKLQAQKHMMYVEEEDAEWTSMSLFA